MLRQLENSRLAVTSFTIVLMALFAPLIVNFQVRVPEWDQLYFLHRGACLNNAVQALSLAGLDECLQSVFKSPVMALLLLPAGPLHGLTSLAVAPVVLAFTTFGLVLIVGQIAQAAQISRLALIGAAATSLLSPTLTGTGAPFLVDMAFSITVLATLLLIPLEYGSPTVESFANIKRGLLWGLLVTLGLLAKLTYFYFAALVFVPLALMSLYLSGWRTTLIKISAASIVGLMPLSMFWFYGAGYIQHAYGAAFGPITAFYDDGLGRLAFIQASLGSLGLSYWFAVAVLCSAVVLGWRKEQPTFRPLLGCYLLIILGIYLFIASGSPNKDQRFFWLVWLALPFCIAAMIPSSHGQRRFSFRACSAAPILLALALSLPMAGRYDLRSVAQVDELLQSLPANQPFTVMIASDEASFNIETLILARELNLSRFRNLSMRTVVYDIATNGTPEQSINRLLGADYVLIRSPVDSSAPEWTNRFLPGFATAVETSGRLIRTLPGNPSLRLFEMHPH